MSSWVTSPAAQLPAEVDRGLAVSVSGAEKVFRVEGRGIDFIPLEDRWATPRNLLWMWAGASIQFEYLIYGAVLMVVFGVSLAQAVVLILLGNLSYVAVGLCSLQGPQAGTTSFMISRAAYGPNGSRIPALLNWLTQVGFESEGLILVVLALEALSAKAGAAPTTGLKIAFIAAAAVVQMGLPFLGHAAVVKTLRALVAPFLVLYVIMAALTLGHVREVRQSADWQTFMIALVFVITLSGLAWIVCGNDYSRYLPPGSSSVEIVGWTLLGGAVPNAAMMLLGAAVATFVPGAAGNPIGGFPRAFPGWFLVPFLVIAIVQIFAISSLDLYSSGVTLQAVGLRVRRSRTVVIDTVFSGAVTAYAVFSSSFSTLLADFAAGVVAWIAPWGAIFLTDWLLRRRRYDSRELQRSTPGGIYWAKNGVHWPAVTAQVIGTVLSVSTFWQGFYHGQVSAVLGRTDYSVFSGAAVGGVVYLLLTRGRLPSGRSRPE